jgi:hypothetical protein
MPNWCNNQIKITGDLDKMKMLVDKFKELETNNESIMGFLLGKEDRPADYAEQGWYEYNCNKFGTKWDFKYSDTNDINVSDSQISIDVMTPWAPPCEFLRSLCAMYSVHARIHYDEPGMDLCGTEKF